MLLLLSTLAMAGYGDAVDGMPSTDERRLFLWTNAARIDPAAFKDSYDAGGCSFDNDFNEVERTPKDPVRWNVDLNEAARYHSADMQKHDYFAHQSFDGTPAMQRIARYYDGPASENIAWGTSITPYASVFEMWMCSTTGHRGNIMGPDWDELGTGIAGLYYTQNFGRRAIDKHGVGMGAHWLESGRITFRAEVFDEGGAAPDLVEVVWNGVPGGMTLEYGVAERGIYRTSRDPAQVVESDQPGCNEVYFQATWGERTERFPETGSYGWGDCLFADADAQWIDRQLEPETEGGCSHVSAAPAGLVASFAGLLIVARRRRRQG